MADNGNPYVVVGTPSYAAPLMDLSGAFKGGMNAGQGLRNGMQQNNQQGQTATQQVPQQRAAPPLYSNFLQQQFGIGTPQQAQQQPQSFQSMQQTNAPPWAGRTTQYPSFGFPSGS